MTLTRSRFLTWTAVGCLVAGVAASAGVRAQTPPPQAPPIPKPFPRPGEPPPATPPPAGTKPQAGAPSGPSTAAPGIPTEASLGAPLYPAAEFLESIDAGRGQTYFLYGTAAPYVDIVTYYKDRLKKDGRVLFQMPPMHQFDLGRFQEQTMAFPPSVVVKDYTWNGAEGYLHVAGTNQKRYRTVIQIVPATAK